ncbi:hypothetical protein [Dactylosporangium sp. NPDC000521]|uniref:hypothetical protein n=1 Tax=Dactylosporangium sp. NPDC000521 TaxID=3363975 RepID=UPI003694E9B1
MRVAVDGLICSSSAMSMTRCGPRPGQHGQSPELRQGDLAVYGRERPGGEPDEGAAGQHEGLHRGLAGVRPGRLHTAIIAGRQIHCT